MKLSYDGVERIIEPYSLAYKRASGRPAREYFYAYDRTGGKSNNPSIKSFLNSGIEALSILEDKFEPRFEIELSKAGEETQKGYFGKNFQSTSRQHVTLLKKTRLVKLINTRSFRGFEQIYKVQCPYCLKTFRRKTTSLNLNEHKSPDGFRCNGRRGHLVFG